MKFNEIVISALAVLVSTPAFSTLPPAPVIMPEDASYECTVALTQLNKEIMRAVISRGSAVIELNKGKEASAAVTIAQIPELKHYQLQVPVGPFRPREKPVSPAPKGTTFEDTIVLQGQYTQNGLDMQLRAIVVSADARSEAFDLASLDSTDSLKTKVVQHSSNAAGSEDRILDVTCTRTK